MKGIERFMERLVIVLSKYEKPLDSNNVIAEIDSGRPIIISMIESLGGPSHAVVAYGYQNYTYPGTEISYLGYITHFGWKSKYCKCWQTRFYVANPSGKST